MHTGRGANMRLAAGLLLLAGGAAGGGFEMPKTALGATPAEQEDAVKGMIGRVLGEEAASLFSLSVVPPKEGVEGADSYTLKAAKGKMTLSGTSGVALSQGVYWYLREHCNSTVSWGRNGTGVCVRVPSPLPDAEVDAHSVVPLRYVYNTCTFGYTFAWWDWERWQGEIDWQALHGVNMPLSFAGQEYVWRELYRGYGVTDEELAAHFSGAPFLPWERMGNLEGWQGPNVEAFFDERHKMQLQILARQRSFGMYPVLPGFAGHVPAGLKRVFPDAAYTTSQAWNGFNQTLLLKPADPLFPKIGKKFIETQTRLYNWTSHFYNADTFNEMDPGSSDADYLKRSSSAVIEGMKAGDPEAKWVMQGWLFISGFWSQDNRQNYLAGVNNSDMIILDLQSDCSPVYTRPGGYFGKSWIWNMLHNFGGRPGVYGDLAKLRTAPLKALQGSGGDMVGMGITPEATEQNPIAYELMLDVPWSNGLPNNWVARWATGRYPLEDPSLSVTAWGQIVDAAYSGREGPSDRRWAMFEVPGPSRLCAIPYLDRNGFVRGWQTLLRLAAGLKGELPSTLRYDLSVFTGYAVLLKGCDALDKQSRESDNWNYGDHSKGQQQKVTDALDNVIAILNDTDEIFNADPNQMLDCWMHDADKWSGDLGQMYRASRRQLTIWGPVDGNNAHLPDYAEKPWGGLMKGYYAARWAVYAEAQADSMKRGGAVSQSGVTTTKLIDFEKQWGNGKQAPEGSCAARGDIVEIAQRMKTKYYHPHPRYYPH